MSGSILVQSSNSTMTHFYESDEDLALRGKGVITGEDVFNDIENVTGMDFGEYLAALTSSSEDDIDDDRREDRYEQMADRHHV